MTVLPLHPSTESTAFIPNVLLSSQDAQKVEFTQNESSSQGVHGATPVDEEKPEGHKSENRKISEHI